MCKSEQQIAGEWFGCIGFMGSILVFFQFFLFFKSVPAFPAVYLTFMSGFFSYRLGYFLGFKILQPKANLFSAILIGLLGGIVIYFSVFCLAIITVVPPANTGESILIFISKIPDLLILGVIWLSFAWGLPIIISLLSAVVLYLLRNKFKLENPVREPILLNKKFVTLVRLSLIIYILYYLFVP